MQIFLMSSQYLNNIIILTRSVYEEWNAGPILVQNTTNIDLLVLYLVSDK